MAWGGDEDVPWTGRVEGYLFEPEYTDEEMRERDSEMAAAAAAAAAAAVEPEVRSPPRLGRPGGADSWCTCGNCEVMETEAMSFCCHECMRMEPLLREMEEQLEREEQPTDDDVQVCISSSLQLSINWTFFSFYITAPFYDRSHCKSPDGDQPHYVPLFF